MRPAGVWLLLLGPSLWSCAAPREGRPPDPGWPYATVAVLGAVPSELIGRPIFNGQWMVADPEQGTVLCESSDPQYILHFSFDQPRQVEFLDLGVQARAENVIFADRGRAALVVASVGNSQAGVSVDARALLRLDLAQKLLLDTIPLGRNEIARGLALDPQERRLFLLADDGAGNGVVEIVDLYGGRTLFRRSIGNIPVGMKRKGIVLDRDGRALYCLAGGESAHSDFPPVGETPHGPELLVLDPDSLTVEKRIPLGEKGSPIALQFDNERNRAVVLEEEGDRSRVLVVDAGFQEVRDRVLVRESATDLVIQGSYAFLPGPEGITVVDLDRALVAGNILLPLARTGDMAVSPDGTRALVLFQGGSPPGPPGIAVVGLNTGTMMDVLQ